MTGSSLPDVSRCFNDRVISPGREHGSINDRVISPGREHGSINDRVISPGREQVF